MTPTQAMHYQVQTPHKLSYMSSLVTPNNGCCLCVAGINDFQHHPSAGSFFRSQSRFVPARPGPCLSFPKGRETEIDF